MKDAIAGYIRGLACMIEAIADKLGRCLFERNYCARFDTSCGIRGANPIIFPYVGLPKILVKIVPCSKGPVDRPFRVKKQT
jgi:hypothetical protein